MRLTIAALALATLASAQTRTAIPDLQGIWTNVTLTQLERPEEFKGRHSISDAEAAAWAKKDKEEGSIDGDLNNKVLRNAGSAGTGAYNDLFIDRGNNLARVDGRFRTSLVIDPADGKVPALTPEAQQRNRGLPRGGGGEGGPAGPATDDVKRRPLSERCIVGFGSTAGPPMLPVLYNNNYQIVQTPDAVMILVEMIHDVRVIRLNGQHAPSNIRFLFGDSIGHYEGDTLVVDTTNYRPEIRFHGSSENLHVIERFRRVDKDTILYRATIDDPTTFTRPWTVEYPFVATEGPIYEYACHEGNYGIVDILSAGAKATQGK